MTRISERVPQLTDDVLVTITLPSTTEEWADELLAPAFDIKREKRTNKLIISKIVKGNADAVAISKNVLSDVEELLLEGDVNPMNFELQAMSMVTALRPKKKVKKLKVKKKT